MQAEQIKIWEDDEYVYIPEELFRYLPKKYREAAQARKEQGKAVLQITDKHIQGLIRLINAIPTTSSLSYIYHRLRTIQFKATMQDVMEQEMLTTAFVATYGRLFTSSNGTHTISKKDLPKRLRAVHDDLMKLRHKRYAHNGNHDTVNSGIEIQFVDDNFHISTQMNIGFHVGGRDEWEELITFIDNYMHEKLNTILLRLYEKTGYNWTFPNGPKPDWVGQYK